MFIALISKDATGYLAAMPTSPMPYRVPAELVEAFKADGDHWDEWSLDMGSSFSTAMTEEACKKWSEKLNPCFPNMG